ncbi:MAG: glycoside hydrolase family 2 TIM barrel-domain containing protein [Luteolibacter sp.]
MQLSPAAETERQYLSGRGPKDAIPWVFSVSKGRQAGEITTIPVPSNWEQQGFGSYDYGNSPGAKSDEHGLYRTRFSVPPGWEGRRIRVVFEGVMTDAEVKVNGKSAGPVHQGGFYRFCHDITSLLNPGKENTLEVDVSKVSANPGTERAERHGDYWIFGGIYRPVYLEAVPEQFIEQVSVDAGADGSFRANIDLGNDDVGKVDKLALQILMIGGEAVGRPISVALPAGAEKQVKIETSVRAPLLWTAETPNLYKARFTLMKGSQELHTVTERFGFRTITVAEGKGIALNGKRILLKGVCRHSFRPETGRALDSADCLADLKLLKAMNMNAVRMSHYPPDVEFLDMCDELGLYVIDELSGWQKAHDTENGKKLVKEMVNRDVNHPSILFWDNGNEGGWNRELDGEFALYDPQNRLVLHPWELMNGVNTKHYPSYGDLVKLLTDKNVVMPTEMLHGLYDGGAGSGLEDYWKAISGSPVGGGGFIWVFADEGIMRTDQGNRVDVFSTYAQDGILGPHHEKKGSFYTVRDVFSPVQIDAPVLDDRFNGKLAVHNRYDFLSLAGSRFNWELLKFPDPAASATWPQSLGSGSARAPDTAAGESGQLALGLPATCRNADALSLVATDATGRELWRWVWPTPALAKRLAVPAMAESLDYSGGKPATGEINLKAGNMTGSFDPITGRILSLRRGDKTSALVNGPRLIYARPSQGGIQWTDAPPLPRDSAGASVWTLEEPRLLNLLEIEMEQEKNVDWAGFKLEVSPDGRKWDVLYDATRRSGDGNTYEFPPQQVASVRLSDFRQAGGKPGNLKRLRGAYQSERFPADSTEPRKVTVGTNWLLSVSADGKDTFRWTLATGGGLRLDYSYRLEGDFIYHGITFDHPEEAFKSVKWLGDGPSRVWQNRLRGSRLGVYEIAPNDIQPGETWEFPEFQGYFAGLRWARFETTSGPLTMLSGEPSTFLRIGTPRISHPRTTVAFPAGDVSFLRVIPAMGTKFSTAEKGGPASQSVKVSGQQKGSIVFHWGD